MTIRITGCYFIKTIRYSKLTLQKGSDFVVWLFSDMVTSGGSRIFWWRGMIMASARSASLYGGLGAVDILRSRSMNFALEMHDFPICITVQISVIMQYYDWFYRLSIHEE